MAKCHPKGHALGPSSSCFLIHFYSLVNTFRSCWFGSRIGPSATLWCAERMTLDGEFSECKTRPRNFCNPLELEDLKDTQESKTSAVTTAWDFMWEDTKSCLHPTSFFAKYCLSKRVGGLSGTSINGNIYILGFHNYRSVFPYKLSVEIFPHKDWNLNMKNGSWKCLGTRPCDRSEWMCLPEDPICCWEMENRVMVKQVQGPGVCRMSEHNIVIQTRKVGPFCKSDSDVVKVAFHFQAA